MKNKVCLLVPYYGKWPVYFNLYLFSLKKNKNLNVIFFTDLKYDGTLPNNVQIINMSLNKLNILASKKIGFKINIKNPYKLCDFKPAYGHIFEDYIKDYDFWAFGDIDLIYGNIFKLLPKNWRDYDILTFREDWITGSFTILRNSYKITRLYKKSKYYKKYFQEEQNFIFDECGGLFCELVNKSPDYILQIDKNDSFTYIVRREELLYKNIKVFSKKIIKESIPKNDYIYYNNGKLIQKDNEEFIYYHYVTEKRKDIFHFPKWDSIPEQFYINRFGFFTVDDFFSFKKSIIITFRFINSIKKYLIKLPLKVKNKLIKIAK